MRCLTLANKLKSHGSECHFITSGLGQYFDSLINKNDHIHHVISKSDETKIQIIDNDPFLFSQTEDAELTSEILKTEGLGVIIVDHYGINYKWHEKIRDISDKIVVIDDLADRKFDCDLLINPTYQMKKSSYIGLVSDYCQVLVGSEYALLRSEFHDLREEAKLQRGNRKEIQRIFIFLSGGMQTKNIQMIIETIYGFEWNEELEIDLVINQDEPIIKDLMEKNKSQPQINVLHNVENMAELILSADFAIGSAGTSTWERCSLGLPSLVKSVADNQRYIAENLSRVGAIKLWETSGDLKNAILKYMLDDTERNRMSQNAFKVCDGIGAVRVSKAILQLI